MRCTTQTLASYRRGSAIAAWLTRARPLLCRRGSHFSSASSVSSYGCPIAAGTSAQLRWHAQAHAAYDKVLPQKLETLAPERGPEVGGGGCQMARVLTDGVPVLVGQLLHLLQPRLHRRHCAALAVQKHLHARQSQQGRNARRLENRPAAICRKGKNTTKCDNSPASRRRGLLNAAVMAK